MSFDSRLTALEQAQEIIARPEVRRFLCDGQADDGGCPRSEWTPPSVPPGSIVEMRICVCTGEGLRSCRYRGGPDGGTFAIQFDQPDDFDEVDL
jgi:hypothetical protein